MTVESLLDRFAARASQPALIVGGKRYRYIDLLNAVEDCLEEQVPRASVVAFEADFSLTSIARLLALWVRASVAVPLPSLQADRMELAEVCHVWTDQGIAEVSARTTHPLIARLYASGQPGLILLTSGSTGTPKAVVHSIETWFDKLARPGKALRTLTFLSMDHVGGLNTLLYTFMNGGTAVVPASRRPSDVWATIAEHQVQLLPTSPTFLRLSLLEDAIPEVPSLETISYGSEPMPSTTLEAMRARLPHVEFLQQYGMSELGVVRSRSKEDGSNWFRLGGPEFGIRVVDGLLEIQATTAMLGYLNAPSPFTEDGWLRTGDEVEQDGRYLRVIGRRSETINVGGEKIHPTEVEAVLESLEGVRYAVVRGEPNAVLGQVVVAAVELDTDESLPDFQSRMRRQLKGVLPRYGIPQRLEWRSGGLTDRMKKARQAA